MFTYLKSASPSWMNGATTLLVVEQLDRGYGTEQLSSHRG